MGVGKMALPERPGPGLLPQGERGNKGHGSISPDDKDPCGLTRATISALGATGVLLLSAAEARADVAPTPVTIPFLLFFFVVPLLAIIARLLLLAIGRFFASDPRATASRSDDSAAASDPRVPALGLRARTWLVVCVFGTAAALYWDITAYRSVAVRQQKRSEARSNLGAIRSTEVAYFAEWNAYVGNQAFTPVANRAGDDQRVAWVGTTRFSILGFAPDQDVYCSYSLEGPDWPTDGFTAVAHCDTDRDGKVAVYTITSGDHEVRKSGGPF